LQKKYANEKGQNEKKIAFLQQENKTKDSIINVKINEIEYMKPELLAYNQLQYEYNSIQDNLKYLLSEIDRLQEDNTMQSKELEVWRYKYSEFQPLESKIQDLLCKIVLNNCEIEALRSQVNIKGQENQSLRNS
ncbi:hypothetical protein IMG5_090480, partial [Ichthyophthirius multifiliis]